MPHWIGSRRASNLPPYPQPPGNNDISSRVSRLEVHQWHMTQDMSRIEAESLQRGVDLRTEVSGLRTDLTAVQGHIGTARTLAGLVPALLKLGAAVVLLFLVLAGKMTVETVKPFLAALGLPSG